MLGIAVIGPYPPTQRSSDPGLTGSAVARCDRSLEVLAVDMSGAGGSIGERLDQHDLIRVVETASPVEADRAALGARCGGNSAISSLHWSEYSART